MTYTLPKSVEVNGREYEIRSDFRAILDILEAINDTELTDQKRAYVVLDIFYPQFAEMREGDYEAAISRCLWFINGGQEDNGKKLKKVMDWQQDFPLVVAPINRVIGYEIRAVEYLHWWTLLAAYQEIDGDCTFAQVVSIRQKLASGKQLDKSDREFYRRNRDMIDLKQRYTDAEVDFIRKWT
jgi:hypothetical protein